jgi:putative membrane protein
MRSEPGTSAARAPGDLGSAPARPRRLHPASVLFLITHRLRTIWPLALLVLARRSAILDAVGAVVAIGVLAEAVLQWLRRTYTLDERALRIDEGVLTRGQRLVPLERIQHVSQVQKLLHRVLGVVRLRIETAGGGGQPEVDLDVIGLAEAARLRAALLAGKAAVAGGVAAPPAAAPPERVLLRLSLGQVVLAGVTGTRAAAILAVVGSASQYLDDLPDSLVRNLDPNVELPPAGLQVILLGVFVVALVWFGLASASSVLTDYGFTLVRTADELVARRGLLDRRESTVPLARVQVVWVDEPVVRRLLGYASVRVQSAGQGSDRVRIPILPAAELDRVLAEVLPRAAPLPPLLRPPRAARRRAVVRRVVPVAVLAALAGVLLWPWGASAVLLLPLAAAAGLGAYRGLGHALRGGYLVARRGWLLRTTAVVPLAKVQSARVLSTPFQRRAGLATQYADVAGGGTMPRVVDESAERAEALLESVVGRVPAGADSRG